MEDQRGALALGQPLEAGDERAELLGAEKRSRVGRGVAERGSVGLDVGRADGAAQDVERAVADDRVEPGLERHLAVVGAQGAQRADERVLDDLLGVVVRAAQELARVREQARLVAVVDRVEGAVVAGADQVDELLVGGGAVGGRVEQDRRHAPRVRPPGPTSHPPRVAGMAPQVASASPWGTLTGQMSGPPSPLKAHSASPAELRDRIEAERRGPAVPRLPRGDGASSRSSTWTATASG